MPEGMGAPQQPYPNQYAGPQPYSNPYQERRGPADFAQSHGMPATTTTNWNPFSPADPSVLAYAESRGFGMKWYKALTIVLLFLAALSYVFTGITTITGMEYGSSRDMIYSFYPALMPLNIVYGLFLLVLALASIYIRMQLAAFKKVGPRYYIIMGLASGIASLLFMLISSLIIGTGFTLLTALGVIMGAGINVALNKVYFDKRAELFVY